MRIKATTGMRVWLGAVSLALVLMSACSRFAGLTGDERFDRCRSDTACDDGNPCTVDACDESTALCASVPSADGTNVDAEPLDCKLYVCKSGVVRVSPANDEVACKVDGLQGKCSNGECATQCVSEADPACDDQNPCTDDACNLDIGRCESTNKANGEPSGVVEDCRVHTCQSGADSWSAEPKGTTCTTCAAAPCVCDNAGSCVDLTCTDEVVNGDETDIDCGGSVCSGCVNGLICQVDADCQSNFCDEGVCQPCVSHDECGADEQCDLVVGNCIPKSDDGTECDEVENCVSGFCVDGVCCDTECDGTCEACTSTLQGAGGITGTCGAIQAGDDPELECDADECNTGTCDGSSACGFFDSTVVCVDQSCTLGFESSARFCDGAGTCLPGALKGCALYVCDVVAQSCLGACSTSADCASSGDYCDAGSQCVQKKDDGQNSTDPTECQSGYANDGVCCDTPCTDDCYACTGAKTTKPDGLCAPVVAGTNPDGDCAGTCTSTCNGAGACLEPAGTVCGASSCDQATSTYNPVHTCNGAMCIPGAAQACGLFACDPNAGCMTSCSSDNDCSAVAECVGPAGGKTCKLRDGQVCGSANACGSGFCADGYCCDTICAGTCRQCNLTGAEGTCSNVPAGFTDNAPVCSVTQACNGAANCKSAAGQSCNTDNDCASDLCYGAVVKSCKARPNQACSGNSDCASSSCNALSLCDKGGSGTPCKTNGDCTSSSCNIPAGSTSGTCN